MEPITLHEASNANKKFLALPAEVRQLVYKFYFPADMALKRLAKSATDFERTTDSKALLNLPPGEGDRDRFDLMFPHSDYLSNGEYLSPLALLQTCRLVYQEALEVPSRRNKFVFPSNIDTRIQLGKSLNTVAQTVVSKVRINVHNEHYFNTEVRTRKLSRAKTSLWRACAFGFPKLQTVEMDFRSNPCSSIASAICLLAPQVARSKSTPQTRLVLRASVVGSPPTALQLPYREYFDDPLCSKRIKVPLPNATIVLNGRMSGMRISSFAQNCRMESYRWRPLSGMSDGPVDQYIKRGWVELEWRTLDANGL